MRLTNYINEKKTLDSNELKREIQKLEKMKSGEEKDNAVVKVMGDIDAIKRVLMKTLKSAKSPELKKFDSAYEAYINAVGALADKKGNTKSVMRLYQHWINVTNGIINKKG